MAELKGDPGIGDYYDRKREEAVAARAALKETQAAYDAAVIAGAGQNELNALIATLRRCRRELEDAENVGD